MNKPMKFAVLGLGLVAALSATTAPVVAEAQVQPPGGLIFGVDRAVDRPALDPVQFFWGGRNFCWYDGGWSGPGWYWCGYAWRRGYGWGGGYGWHGWRGGHPGGRGFVGRGARGGPPPGRGGGDHHAGHDGHDHH
jgi:hypothetical protein